MSGISTKSVRLQKLVTYFAERKSLINIFCHNKITCATCTRGYVVTCSNKNWHLKNIISCKTELFISELCVGREFSTEQDIQSINFIKLSTETLESLSEYFDEIIEQATHLQDADVSSGDGVLTVKFGSEYGTYVINRQIPNLQIWLSSPKSGPKRYDFIDGTWIYKHDGKSLHELLNEEIADIVKFPVLFTDCSYGIKKSIV
ncbi:frataxin homolog, mitochondrial [Phymastichus coffea]|uniref:frataxin homolog, mitochondrial n=1 Tax=Phymastichus coffea TaxID=108790 RepID=UPI00273C3578|nr:frataxin homolog, mitochondrial [Phymastichus coffea]